MEGMEGMEGMGGATTPDIFMQQLSANYRYLLLLPSTYFYLLKLTTGFALHLMESASTMRGHYFE